MQNCSRFIPAILLLGVLLLSCGGEGDTPRSKMNDVSEGSGADARGEAGVTGQSPLLPDYTVIAVENGGKIRGRLLLEGKTPKLSDFEITTNPDICAGAADNNRLQVGDDGGIAWGVVRLIGVKQGKGLPALSPDDLTVDQVGCRYTPHVVAVPIGTKVIFRNSDPTPHNVRVENTSENILMNVAQPGQGDVDTFRVKQEGPMSVGCDYHPWMNAYVFGVNNPYYAVTNSDGSFEIADIPPGEYELRMWLNGFEPKPKRDNRGNIIRYRFSASHETSRSVVIEAGKTVEEIFRINSAN